MDDLISRRAAQAIKVLPKCYRNYQTDNLDDAYEKGWEDALFSLNALPTIDPVKHELSGEWIPIEMRYGFGCGVFDCTLCHNTAEIPVENGLPTYNFCPHCGARMNE